MKRTGAKAALIGLLAASTAAQEEEWAIDIDALVGAGRAVVARIEDLGLDLSLLANAPSPDEWGVFWTRLESTLADGSVEDYAWLKPYAEQALVWLDTVQGAEPYADWLRQRLDYFDVADEAVQLAEPELTRPPAPPPQRITVPPQRPPRPADPARVAKAERRATDRETWKRKLSSRPAPARAAKLVPVLEPIFREEGLPGSLVWLAEVESTFDPEARSPVGAAGLYQLMPATAERFGLRVRLPDERMHPEKNARAAAKYLKLLHREFASWPLAFAAYNAGEGRVRRLLRQQSASGFDDIAGRLPTETRLYVPKVLAIIEVRSGRPLPGG